MLHDMPSRLTIGALAARTGLAVRTVRFYADNDVVAVADRSESGYRLFDETAVARLRLVRTLRELGVGLEDIRRIAADERTLADVAAAHARALDVQIDALRLQRAVLRAVSATTDPKELERMSDLTTMTAQERRAILDDYLDHVFGDRANAVADRMAHGAPELPDDPTPEQLEAWVELAGLLRDPGFRAASKAMADRAAEDPATHQPPDDATAQIGFAIGREGAAALERDLDPASAEARAIVERIEAMTETAEDRTAAADRIEAFTDERVARYWQLVSTVNGWEPQPDLTAAYLWYAKALRAHA